MMWAGIAIGIAGTLVAEALAFGFVIWWFWPPQTEEEDEL